jgi:hypothetical protein
MLLLTAFFSRSFYANSYGVFDNLAFRVDDDGALTLLGQVTRRIVKDSTPTPARPAPSS